MIFEITALSFILLFSGYIFFSLLKTKQLANSKQKSIFMMLVAAIVLWVISIFITDLFFRNAVIALWASRASFASSALITFLYNYFVTTYIKGRVAKYWLILWTIISAALFLISFTPLLLSDVVVYEDSLASVFGIMQLPYISVTGLGFLGAGSMFWIAYRREENSVRKMQILYMLVGSLLSIITIFITNLIFPLLGFKEIRALGPMGLVFFIFATYYSIIRYRFLSSKILFSRLLYTLSVAIIPYGIFHAIIFLQDITWGGVYETGALISGYFYSVLFIYVFSVAASFIKSLYQKIIHGEDIEPDERLAEFTVNIEESLEVEYILKEAIEALSDVLSSDSEILMNIPEERYFYSEAFDVGISELQKLEKTTLFVRDELSLDAKIDKSTISLLNDKGIQIALKFSVFKDDGLFGMILIKERSSFKSYSVQELEYMKSISRSLSVGLQRAFLHQRALSFNQVLQGKIDIATKELKDNIEKLEEARNKERDMIDIMGHELRTPASVVKMNIELLNAWRGKINQETIHTISIEEFDKYMKRIADSIDNEIRIINTLLTSAKLEGSRLELNMTSVNVDNALELSIDGNRVLADQKKLYIKLIKPEEGLPLVYADKGRFQEILDNIIGNAVKYTHQGGVQISVNYDSRFVIFSVEDTGQGMSKDDLAKLGEKFYRTNQYISKHPEETNKLVRPGGTGLGLYVVFGLIRAHGGDIKVESEVGEGSKFTFWIPVSESIEGDDETIFSGNMFDKLKLTKANNNA